MRLIARLALPAAATLLLALASPATAQETAASPAAMASAEAGAPATGAEKSPAAAASAENTNPAPVAASSDAVTGSPEPAVAATPPSRAAVEHRDLSDARFGNWLWPASMIFCAGLIAIGYLLIPKPADKVTRGYVTSSAGTFQEEEVV